MNFFTLDDNRRLVDLPGYGYAKVAESVKRQWQQTLADYIEHRQCLQGLVLLMDIRHPLTEFNMQMLQWNTQHGLPTHILLSKADKLKSGATKNVLLKVKKALSDHPEISIQRFSSLKKQGIDECHQVLDIWFDLEQPETPMK